MNNLVKIVQFLKLAGIDEVFQTAELLEKMETGLLN